MRFEEFLKIAKYGNEMWKGNFTEEEIVVNAQDYKAEYDYSLCQGKPTRIMVSLCELISLDMGMESVEALTLEQMQKMLTDFVNEI